MEGSMMMGWVLSLRGKLFSKGGLTGAGAWRIITRLKM
jgi:hypothetical protein